jgi:Tfp pilus assembly protein PilO
MNQVKSSTWILGAVLLGLVVIALSWFVLASPVLDEAAIAQEDAEAAELRNGQLRVQNAALKEEFERLPELEAELAALQVHVPTTPLITEYNLTLGQLAQGRGVTILTVETGPAVEVMPVAPVDGAAEVIPTAADGVSGLYAIPLTIGALGTYDNTTLLLDDLQQANPRLLSVTGLTIEGQDEAEASGGRPATARGDAEQTITGYLYVLSPDATVTVDAPADDPAAAEAAPVEATS